MSEITDQGGLIDLPPETLVGVLSLLEPIDVAKVSITCRSLYDLCVSDAVW